MNRLRDMGYDYVANERCVCGKIAFDKKSALTKKNSLERLGRERLEIYQCRRADTWHLTKLDRYEK